MFGEWMEEGKTNNWQAMTEEQEEAIKILSNSNILMKIQRDTALSIRVAIEMALDMLKDLQRENKNLTQTNKSYKGMIREKDKEIEKKDKIIDLMAELIARKAGSRIEICHNMQCDKKVAKECKVCTKQYFERKATKND